MNSLIDETSQVIIIHLSDIHFGRQHRFNPSDTPNGDKPFEKDFPTLIQKLQEDLSTKDPRCPVIICITGDIVETASVEEFNLAENFIKELRKINILGKTRSLKSIFIVPGNHDIKYDSENIGIRWQQFTDFFNRVYDTKILRENPWQFAQVYDRVDEFGIIVVSINSSIYIEKDKPDEDRGRLDIKQLTQIEEQLMSISSDRLKKSIKIAIMHHHPVLIPALAEPGRGYDAVHNSGKLITILGRYGFHLILHGHKHNPYTFTDDTRSAHQNTLDHPILIAAGGSVGSLDIPNNPRSTNCYNLITVKWHPAGKQSRVKIITKGLSLFNDDNTARLPTQWKWSTLKIDDRPFFGFHYLPTPTILKLRKFDEKIDKQFEKIRREKYEKTRGNLPVVQVLPSLIPGQAYEAILWIVQHPYGEKKPERDIPTKVTWSAGKMFEVISITRDQNPNYCVKYDYWGPMLVQAKLEFSDKHEALIHIYAKMPTAYEINSI